MGISASQMFGNTLAFQKNMSTLPFLREEQLNGMQMNGKNKITEIIEELGNKAIDRKKFDTFEPTRFKSVEGTDEIEQPTKLSQQIAKIGENIEYQFNRVKNELQPYQDAVDYYQSALNGEFEAPGFSEEVYTEKLANAKQELNDFSQKAAERLNGHMKIASFVTQACIYYASAEDSEGSKETLNLNNLTDEDFEKLKEEMYAKADNSLLLNFMKEFKFSPDNLVEDMDNFMQSFQKKFEEEFGSC